MELTISEQQVKALLKEALVELMEEKPGLFSEVILDAIEIAGLANAIREGRQDDFVGEEQIRLAFLASLQHVLSQSCLSALTV